MSIPQLGYLLTNSSLNKSFLSSFITLILEMLRLVLVTLSAITLIFGLPIDDYVLTDGRSGRNGTSKFINNGRNALINPALRWPGGVVPVLISPEIGIEYSKYYYKNDLRLYLQAQIRIFVSNFLKL